MNAYYFLSRLASPFVTTLFYLYSLIMNTPRTRVLVENEAGEILLLQVWPDTSVWNLPGGGIKRSERPDEAASRELREEAGIEVPADNVRHCLTLRSRGHQELVYRTTAQRHNLPDLPPNRWEVRRTGWFPPDSLPRVSPEARRIIGEVAR